MLVSERDKKIWTLRFKDHLSFKEIASQLNLTLGEVEYACRPYTYKGSQLLDKFLIKNNLTRKIPRRQYNYEVIYKMHFIAGMSPSQIGKEIGKSRQYVEQVLRGITLQQREELQIWKTKNGIS